MSKYSKIAKNAEIFKINEMYSKMNPEQIREAINTAVNAERKRLLKEYQGILDKTIKECNDKIKENTLQAINTISVELLYELANQMGYWDMEEDDYRKESAKFRIQETYENTMKAVTEYAKMTKNNQAVREYKKKYKKIEKEFDIKF